MDEDRRRVCAYGWLRCMDCIAAGHPPWWTEEGMGEEQEGNENRAIAFLAKVSLIKAQ